MNGVIAATLARNDFIGSSESVEGKHGLLVGYSDNAHPDKAVAGLGSIYETMKIGVKPYPSCRYTHAALDALIAMRREHNLTPDQIKRVEIGLHRNGITLTGDAATKRHPTSIVGGQFSMFFTGAVALDQGRFGWDDYERLGDAAVNAIADRFGGVQDDRRPNGRHAPVRRARQHHHRGRHARAHLCRSVGRAVVVSGRGGDAAEISHARAPGIEWS